MSTEPDSDYLDLPAGWRRVDGWILRATRWMAIAVGLTFTMLVSLEVASRYLLDFSIFWVNSASIFLLVWFFLLGAGLALRQGAHVGLELLIAHLSPRLARITFLIAQVPSLIFFCAMLWSGLNAIGPASRQMEGALGISLMWVMLAFPVGFLLLLYNQAAMFVAALRKPGGRDRTP